MAGKGITQSTVMGALDWTYDRAVNGLPGLDTAAEMAADYMATRGSHVDQANSLIRWQIAKASTSGFLTSLGGLLTMPVTLPANMVSVFYVQLRMVAAIAHIGGYDVRSDQVRTLAYACLCGSAASDVLKEVGVKIGTKLTQSLIKKISGEVIKSINKAVGFRLLTKFGTKGVINLGRAVPFLGGLIGGTFDGVTTNTIGNVARDLFLGDE
jgi:hypothetical protein